MDALPIDILELVCSNLEKWDLKTVRLVSSELDDVCVPQLFSSLYIFIWGSMGNGHEILRAFGDAKNGPHRLAKYVRHVHLDVTLQCYDLNLYPHAGRSQCGGMKKLIKDMLLVRTNLEPTLASCTRLRSCRWKLHRYEYTWVRQIIANALSSKQELTDLVLDVDDYMTTESPGPIAPLSLESIQGLSSITVLGGGAPQCRALWHPLKRLLSINDNLKSLRLIQNESNWSFQSHPIDAPQVDDLLTGLPPESQLTELVSDTLPLTGLNIPLHCLKSLTTLRIVCDETAPSFWSGLMAGGVILCDIEADLAYSMHTFLEYISSYTGIERITIGCSTGPNNWGIMAEKFYSQVLPLHHGTLRHLSLKPRDIKEMYLDGNNARHLSSLSRLHTLILMTGEHIHDLHKILSTLAFHSEFNCLKMTTRSYFWTEPSHDAMMQIYCDAVSSLAPTPEMFPRSLTVDVDGNIYQFRDGSFHLTQEARHPFLHTDSETSLWNHFHVTRKRRFFRRVLGKLFTRFS